MTRIFVDGKIVPHNFERRTTDAFCGPPDETCEHCGHDPRNVAHETPPERPLLSMMADVNEAMRELDEHDVYLSAAIVRIEKSMRDVAGIGIRISTKIDGVGMFEFGKFRNEWRFTVVTDRETVALASMPRDVRAQAFIDRWFEQLILAAPDIVDRNIDRRSQAVKNAEEILDAFGVDKHLGGVEPPK